MHSLLQVNSGWQGEGGLKIKSAVKTKQKYVTSVNRSFIICQYLHVICSENSTFYRNCSWSSIEVATMHGKVLAQTDNCNSNYFKCTYLQYIMEIFKRTLNHKVYNNFKKISFFSLIEMMLLNLTKMNSKWRKKLRANKNNLLSLLENL